MMIGPIHTGVTLREDFMEPRKLSANGLSKALGIPQKRISDIVRGRRGITANTAFWLNLQSHYELKIARRDAGSTIEKTVKRLATAA